MGIPEGLTPPAKSAFGGTGFWSASCIRISIGKEKPAGGGRGGHLVAKRIGVVAQNLCHNFVHETANAESGGVRSKKKWGNVVCVLFYFALLRKEQLSRHLRELASAVIDDDA